MDNSFPHHDTVNGDLIVASKTLAMLGWAAPAALTARVAIERGLVEMARLHGLPADYVRLSDLTKRLYRKNRPKARHLERCKFVYSDLSAVAHGTEIRLLDAVRLVEQTEAIVIDWRKELSS